MRLAWSWRDSFYLLLFYELDRTQHRFLAFVVGLLLIISFFGELVKANYGE